MDTMIKTEERASRQFNIYEDRCDACGARAVAAATKDDKELLFCRHDINKHEAALTTSNWRIEISSDEV